MDLRSTLGWFTTVVGPPYAASLSRQDGRIIVSAVGPSEAAARIALNAKLRSWPATLSPERIEPIEIGRLPGLGGVVDFDLLTPSDIVALRYRKSALHVYAGADSYEMAGWEMPARICTAGNDVVVVGRTRAGPGWTLRSIGFSATSQRALQRDAAALAASDDVVAFGFDEQASAVSTLGHSLFAQMYDHSGNLLLEALSPEVGVDWDSEGLWWANAGEFHAVGCCDNTIVRIAYSPRPKVTAFARLPPYLGGARAYGAVGDVTVSVHGEGIWALANDGASTCFITPSRFADSRVRVTASGIIWVIDEVVYAASLPPVQ